MQPVEQLAALAKQAEARISVTFNAPDVLPFATQALSLISQHPELQHEFEDQFLEMHSYAPTEFVEVCMHALRWERVRNEFQRRHRSAIERNDWSAEPVYRHYLEAFEPNWENATDFYRELFARRKGEA